MEPDLPNGCAITGPPLQLHSRAFVLTSLCDCLQEHKYWEESFQVYERGIALFKWPHVRDIWRAYLSQFVERYGGAKLERARDLFRQALDSVSHTAHPLGTLAASSVFQFLDGSARHLYWIDDRTVSLLAVMPMSDMEEAQWV